MANLYETNPPAKSLISQRFAAIAYWGIDRDNLTLDYYIHLGKGYKYLSDGTYLYSVGHSKQDIKFIKNIFKKLDPLIDLDFNRSKNNRDTGLDIYSVSDYSEWDPGVLGKVVPHVDIDNELAYWNTLWRDSDGQNGLSKKDKHVIIHEIGHSLGLSHPYEQPRNSAWDSFDTVMSYNDGPSGPNTWFTEADIAALQAIWGKESDKNAEGFSEVNYIEGTGKKDKLRGTRFDDDIYGKAGDDVINAKSGDDWIYPGSSKRKGDIIKTGKGYDVVIANPNGYAIIKDFELDYDSIDVSKLADNPAGDLFYRKTGGWTIIGDDDYDYLKVKGRIDFYIDDNGYWY